MSKLNDGGPAFPRQHAVSDANDDAFKQGCEGMSLRDYFAAKALSGALYASQKDWSWIPECQHAPLAKQAYEIADAMLKERDK